MLKNVVSKSNKMFVNDINDTSTLKSGLMKAKDMLSHTIDMNNADRKKRSNDLSSNDIFAENADYKIINEILQDILDFFSKAKKDRLNSRIQEALNKNERLSEEVILIQLEENIRKNEELSNKEKSKTFSLINNPISKTVITSLISNKAMDICEFVYENKDKVGDFISDNLKNISDIKMLDFMPHFDNADNDVQKQSNDDKFTHKQR